jgi:hypothetical protein
MKRILSTVAVAVVVSMALGQEPARTKSPEQLIDELDDIKFRVRDAAFDELARMGDKAAPALHAALGNPKSIEVRDRLMLLLAMRKPSEFNADFNGWHWVYSWIVHAQTFEATGANLRTLRLRVAQLSANRPTAPLDVEIRDKKLETIYLRGTINPAVLERDFRWQSVTFKQNAPLRFGETYAILFHSRANSNTSPWAINAIYQNVYPLGHHWYNTNEDFFFHIEYREGTSVRVGPKTDADAKMATPINSGTQGGNVGNGGDLALQGFGRLPIGKLKE